MDAIPTFVINLKRRPERRAHVLQEFEGRSEFDLHVVDAQEHRVGALGLWRTIVSVLQMPEHAEKEYLIICEDDHQFREEYSAALLRRAIGEAMARNADVLSGGVSWFGNALALSEHLFWVDRFSGLQFVVLFKKFYRRITEAAFGEQDAGDTRISMLSADKYFIYPFISTQRDFGYSDVTPRNNIRDRVKTLFANSMTKAGSVRYICDYFGRGRRQPGGHAGGGVFDGLSLPVYIIRRDVEGADILEQFRGRDEFTMAGIETCREPAGEEELWQCMKRIVGKAIAEEDELILVCRDGHVFTGDYNREVLFRNIMEAYCQGVEILSGGAERYDIAIPVTSERFWINSLGGASLLLLFRSLFGKIMAADFGHSDTVDGVLSRLTSYKMSIYPSISAQRGEGPELLTKVSEQLALVQKIYQAC